MAGGGGGTERERERNRNRENDRERKIHRQTERERQYINEERERERETDRQTDREPDRNRQRERERQEDRQRQVDRQRRTGRGIHSRELERESEREREREREKERDILPVHSADEAQGFQSTRNEFVMIMITGRYPDVVFSPFTRNYKHGCRGVSQRYTALFFRHLTPALCDSGPIIRPKFGSGLAAPQQHAAKQRRCKFAFFIGHLSVVLPDRSRQLPPLPNHELHVTRHVTRHLAAGTNSSGSC